MDEDPLSLQEESLSVCDVKANRMATLSLQLPDTIIQAISTIPFASNPEFKIPQLGLFLIMAHSPLVSVWAPRLASAFSGVHGFFFFFLARIC